MIKVTVPTWRPIVRDPQNGSDQTRGVRLISQIDRQPPHWKKMIKFRSFTLFLFFLQSLLQISGFQAIFLPQFWAKKVVLGGQSLKTVLFVSVKQNTFKENISTFCYKGLFQSYIIWCILCTSRPAAVERQLFWVQPGQQQLHITTIIAHKNNDFTSDQ